VIFFIEVLSSILRFFLIILLPFLLDLVWLASLVNPLN